MARSNPEGIEYINRLKFASRFQYVTIDHTRDDVRSANYFHNLSQNYLRAGDEICVIVLDDGIWRDGGHAVSEGGGWHKGDFEVVSMTPISTVVRQLGKWRSAAAEENPAATTTKKAA